MKINDRVHQLRVQFNITPEITRYVYVYIITGKKGCYLVDAGVKGCDKKIGEYIHKIGNSAFLLVPVIVSYSVFLVLSKPESWLLLTFSVLTAAASLHSKMHLLQVYSETTLPVNSSLH